MSLPADYQPCAVQARRHPSPLPQAGVADLRGVLHDVGHGLFTLSLLLSQAVAGVRDQLDTEAFELMEAEVAQLLAVVHTGTRSSGDPVPVELHTLLRPFAVVARRTSLTKLVVQPGPPVVVHTDPARLWRIVTNLVDNAVRAAGPLGTVNIVVNHPDAPHVIIDVIDDGPGFQRGPSGIAQLGLGVVNRLLSECGGRLRIDDVVPHGTRMRVLLPAPPAATSLVERTDAFRTDVFRAGPMRAG